MRTKGLEKQLLKLVREYNPEFSQEEMEALINEGSLDFFYDATEVIPETDIHHSNARRINRMYEQIREDEGVSPERWRSEQYLGFSSIPTQSTHIGKSDYLNQEDKFIMNAFNDGGELVWVDNFDNKILKNHLNANGIRVFEKEFRRDLLLEKTKSAIRNGRISDQYVKKYMLPNLNNGGYVDLFEHYEKQPQNLKLIVDNYMALHEEGADYSDTQKFLQEVESVGYTFDYYLDNEPYGLRPKGVALNQLEGYEQFNDGGEVKEFGNTLVYHDRKHNRYTTIGKINNNVLTFSVFADFKMKQIGEEWAKKNGYMTKKYNDGGQLSDVSDMLPHSEPMGVIQPMNIMETVQPMYSGGGKLKPIPEGNKGLPKLPKEVRNRMGYMNNGGGVNPNQSEINYIENRIYNLEQLRDVAGEDDINYYNKLIADLEKEKQELISGKKETKKKRFSFFNNGGGIESNMKRALANQDILNLLQKNGNDRLSYSEYELSEIGNYISKTELPKDLCDSLWGLIIQNKKESLNSLFNHSKALIINSSTGNILKYPFINSMPMVDAINSDSDENQVARLLCKAENLNIYSDALKTLNEYELVIINNSVKASLSDLKLAKSKSKPNNLVIFVCPTSVVYGNNNEKDYINHNFDVVTMYLLENRSMDVCISVLKTK